MCLLQIITTEITWDEIAHNDNDKNNKNKIKIIKTILIIIIIIIIIIHTFLHCSGS